MTPAENEDAQLDVWSRRNVVGLRLVEMIDLAQILRSENKIS